MADQSNERQALRLAKMLIASLPRCTYMGVGAPEQQPTAIATTWGRTGMVSEKRWSRATAPSVL